MALCSPTTDVWVRETIRSGLSLEFTSGPRFFIRCPISRDVNKRKSMETAIQHLLDIQGVEVVPVDQEVQGYYSMLFVIQKAPGC